MYTCPMHPEIQEKNPGKCPICDMTLVEKGSDVTTEKASYTPLIVVVGIILLITLTLTIKDIVAHTFLFSQTITYFMIGFFLAFSGFKLMDIKGFAEGYSMYDLLAKKWMWYGYIYTFLELFFGLSMILFPMNRVLLIAELTVMTFSGVGVAIKIAKKEKFQCACLGTFLKVPLTNITLVEDFGMAILALILLLH